MNKNNNPPKEGTPEFEQWLETQAQELSSEIFGKDHKPAEFENGGVLVGNIENLEKTDAELFPDELEEYTPEERRKLIKLHKNTDNT